MTALDVLKRVRRDLLEIGWVQGRVGRPETGMCLSGWVTHEACVYFGYQVARPAWDDASWALTRTSPDSRHIVKTNDKPGRTLEEIVAWVDRAIAHLEAGVEDAAPVRDAVCA